jgi:hypothetical protein
MATTSDTDQIEEHRKLKELIEAYLASGGKVTHCEAYRHSPQKLPPVEVLNIRRKPGRPPKVKTVEN